MPDVVSIDCTTGTVTTRAFTPAEVAQQTVDQTAATTRLAAADAFHGQILAIAQSGVGITLANLTPAQIKALAAVLLYKAGGVDPVTLQVLPLSQWT